MSHGHAYGQQGKRTHHSQAIGPAWSTGVLQLGGWKGGLLRLCAGGPCVRHTARPEVARAEAYLLFYVRQPSQDSDMPEMSI